MQTQGKREVGEAVLIAALSALLTGMVNWGLETSKARMAARSCFSTALARRSNICSVG